MKKQMEWMLINPDGTADELKEYIIDLANELCQQDL